jgi:hypothetical protein
MMSPELHTLPMRPIDCLELFLVQIMGLSFDTMDADE